MVRIITSIFLFISFSSEAQMPYFHAHNYTDDVPILDVYPNAVFAYSLKKQRTAYTGNCIKIRRTTDNTEQDIGFGADGNVNESSILSFIGSGHAAVTKWYDQSGNGYDATQTDTANQPYIALWGAVTKNNGRIVIAQTGSFGSYPNRSADLYIPATGITTASLFFVGGINGGMDASFLILNEYPNADFIYLSSPPPNTNNSYGGVGGVPTYYTNASSTGVTRAHVHTDFSRNNIGTDIINVVSLVNINLTSWSNFHTSRRESGFITGAEQMCEYIMYGSDKSSDRAAIEILLNKKYNAY